MKSALLIFPHQLFSDHPGFHAKPDKIVISEDPLFFGDDQYPCNFHKQKLVLHRASMRRYFDNLKSRYDGVQYYEYADKASKLGKIFKQLLADNIEEVCVCDVSDYTLQKRLEKHCADNDIALKFYNTPLFLNSKSDNEKYRSGKKRWFMADFYQYQRKRLNLLMDGDDPKGGRWSFDEDNRKKLPKKEIKNIPKITFPDENDYVAEAKIYVARHRPNALGNVDHFLYPIDHESAKNWLDNFLNQRFANFGPYEDAIVEDQNYLYHSLLTPMLNIGLLTPQYVVDKAMEHAKKHDIGLASLEGFIRQIIGWREFMRATYDDLGVSMRKGNHWKHDNDMPASLYDGSSGIEPIDNCIKRALDTGYSHHIERLMVLGGFMFLCEIKPDHIYKWFMEIYIDSYDWVMVPNIYAMSQNADGGQITTKPYFSGSNYIRKMSHYTAGEWSDAWDGLYWRWILKEADALRKNPRWSMMVSMAERMDGEKKEMHLKNARAILQKLQAN